MAFKINFNSLKESFLSIFIILLTTVQITASPYGLNFTAEIKSVNKAGYITLQDRPGNYWLYASSQVKVDVVNELLVGMKVTCRPLRKRVWSFWYTKVLCKTESLGDIGLFLFNKELAVPLCPEARNFYLFCDVKTKPFNQP